MAASVMDALAADLDSLLLELLLFFSLMREVPLLCWCASAVDVLAAPLAAPELPAFFSAAVVDAGKVVLLGRSPLRHSPTLPTSR